jgi:uncharacterized protein YecE (DUF72 family)
MGQAYFGTSGFDYPEWKPSFYPSDLKRKEFLRYYATRFRSVELNNTFYRIPNAERIKSWGDATPELFRFTMKAPRSITHIQRLAIPSEALSYFLQVSSGLGNRLGALLFQLPPFLKCNEQKLAAFLSALPTGIPVAFEFRHDSWFNPQIYRILEEHAAALCIHDSDDGTTPLVVTSRLVYLRLRRSKYLPEARNQWLDRIRIWTAEGRDVFAYIKHEDNPDAPIIALEFAK